MSAIISHKNNDNANKKKVESCQALSLLIGSWSGRQAGSQRQKPENHPRSIGLLGDLT